MNRRTVIVAGLACVYALLVRFAVLWDRAALGTFRLFVDSRIYQERAAEILDGAIVPASAFFMSPAYPYFLALAPGKTGPNVVFAAGLQILAAVAGLWGLALWARRLGGEVAMLATLCLGAIAGPLVLYDTSLLPDGPAFALSGVGLGLLALGAGDPERRRYFAGAGFAFGLASAFRSNLLLTAVLLLMFILWTSRRPKQSGRGLAPAVTFLIPLLLTMALIATFNGLAERIWSPLSQNSGVNLYIGNNPQATGLYTDLDGRIASLDDPRGRREPESVLGAGLDSREVNRYWTGLALESMSAEPGTTAALWFRKFLLAWTPDEIPQMEHYGLSRIESAGFMFAPAGFALILALAAAGLPVAVRRRKDAFPLLLVLLAAAGTCTLFFVNGRLRLPLWCGLLPLAGAGAAHLLEILKSRSWKRLVTAALLAGAAALLPYFVEIPLAEVTSREYSALRYALVEAEAGNKEESRQWAMLEQEWRAGSPVTPEVAERRGIVWARLEDYPTAFKHLRIAADAAPNNLERQQGLLAICRILEDRGELDDEVRRAAIQARRRIREASTP